jgi:MYXO-CTERM domain-containing protein
MRSAPVPDRDGGGPRWAFALAALALGTVLLYARALGYGFSSYDDELYVTANDQVKRGLSWAGRRSPAGVAPAP